MPSVVALRGHRMVTRGLRETGQGEDDLLGTLPGEDGKTTFAQSLGDGFRVISSDEIRKRLRGCSTDAERGARVWETFEALKCKALKEGHDVILDACHISQRARWHSLQGPNGSHKKVCIVFDLPFRIVRARCLREKRLPGERIAALG